MSATAGDPGPHAASLASAGERAIHALRLVGLRLATQLHARVELLQIDLQSEKQRLQRFSILCATAVSTAVLAVLLLIALVVALTWDTPYRVTAIAAMAVVAVVVAAWAVWRASTYATTIARPFAATLAELSKDRDALEDL